MIVKLLFFIFFIFFCIKGGICQSVYENKSKERIILLNDSTVKFEFVYPNVECIANYSQYKRFLEVEFKLYTVQIDTLKDQTCSGFYINNADVCLSHNKGVNIPDSNIIDFIPFSFESKVIQFEFRQKEVGLDPLILEGIEEGCYRLTYIFSSCSLIDIINLKRIEVRKKGKQLILDNVKYKLVRQGNSRD